MAQTVLEQIDAALSNLLVALQDNGLLHCDRCICDQCVAVSQAKRALAREQQEREAAPEALAACYAAVAATGGSRNWNGETKAFLELCEAAIDKAKGTT